MSKILILAVCILITGCGGGGGSSDPPAARASEWGFDPEDSTESLQAAIDSGERRLLVDNVGQPWIVGPITLTSDQEIIFESGVEVIAKQGEFKGKEDCLFRADHASNVTLTGNGATLRMRRDDYVGSGYEHGEWRHVLSIRSCSNVAVTGLTLVDSGGDGIYLGTATRGIPNTSVRISGVTCDGNYRQGITVTSAEGLLIEDTVMRNTGGTPPQAGIDFEPNNHDDQLANIVLSNCTTQDNAGNGYAFHLQSLNAASTPISVRLTGCRSIGGESSGLRIDTGNGPGKAVGGGIEITDCSFQDSRDSGIVISDIPVGGCRVRFGHCSVINPGKVPILFQSGSDASEPIGGLTFTECSIVDSRARSPMAHEGTAPVQDITGTLILNGDRTVLTPELLAEWMQGN